MSRGFLAAITLSMVFAAYGCGAPGYYLQTRPGLGNMVVEPWRVSTRNVYPQMPSAYGVYMPRTEHKTIKPYSEEWWSRRTNNVLPPFPRPQPPAPPLPQPSAPPRPAAITTARYPRPEPAPAALNQSREEEPVPTPAASPRESAAPQPTPEPHVQPTGCPLENAW